MCEHLQMGKCNWVNNIDESMKTDSISTTKQRKTKSHLYLMTTLHGFVYGTPYWNMVRYVFRIDGDTMSSELDHTTLPEHLTTNMTYE